MSVWCVRSHIRMLLSITTLTSASVALSLTGALLASFWRYVQHRHHIYLTPHERPQEEEEWNPSSDSQLRQDLLDSNPKHPQHRP